MSVPDPVSKPARPQSGELTGFSLLIRFLPVVDSRHNSDGAMQSMRVVFALLNIGRLLPTVKLPYFDSALPVIPVHERAAPVPT
jgi:hypothetical protein